MSVLLWSVVLLPAVAGGLLVSAAGRTPARTGAVPALAVAVATATAGLAVAAALTRPTVSAPFLPAGPLELRVDGLSAVVIVVVSAVTAAVLLTVPATVPREQRRFAGLMLLFLAAVLVTATATTLTGLLLAWEIMGAVSYALIAFDWRENGPPAAGSTAFLVTRTGDLGLYLAAGAALAVTAPGPLPALALDRLPQLDGPWLHLAAAGVLAAGLGKAAQLPFSFWLSRAMVGPAPVSALLHSAAMVAMGGYLLLRLHPLLTAAGWAAPAAAWAGGATAVLLGAVAVAQRDIKQLLAASTSAQLGFVVLAAGAGGTAAGSAQFTAHAAVKSLLFLTAGGWVAAAGTQDLPGLRGAARRHRGAGAVFTVGALALAGLPPLPLWASKDETLAVLAGDPALYAVTLAAAALSAGYAGKLLGLLLARPDRPDALPVPRAAWLPPALLATAVVGLGALALPPVAHWLKTTVGAPDEASPGALTMTVSALLAVAATAWGAARAAQLPAPRPLRHWLYLDTAVRRTVVRPVFATARALARFDDAVLDRGVRATAAGARRAAVLCAAVDRSAVDRAVEAAAVGARRLGELARRPQTGQLHQYYIQTAAGTAAAAALLLLLLLSR